jgi:hypothetical protein
MFALAIRLDNNQITLLWRDPCIVSELQTKERLDRYVFHVKWHDLLANPQNLKSISDQKLKDFFDEYYGKGAGRHTFMNIHRGRIIMSVRQFRSMLLDLFNEKKDIVTRMNEVLEGRHHIHGVGRALVTSLLLDFDPSKYVIWNDVVDRALATLGRKPKKERGESVGQTYARIIHETEKIRRLAPRQYGNYLDVDLFYYVVVDKPVGRRAVSEILVHLPKPEDVRPVFVHINDAFSSARRSAAGSVLLVEDGSSNIDKESSRRAEEIVLCQERVRLKKAGRPDLARKVRDVSDQVGLGYDIESFAEKGEAIQVEVKSTKGKKMRGFHLTSSEWLAAQKFGRTYEVHIVLQPQKSTPRISKIPHFSRMVETKRLLLQPSEYFASPIKASHLI